MRLLPPSPDLSKDNVTVVQPRGFDGTNEELGAVCVFASVGHGDPSSAIVLQLQNAKGISEFINI